MVKKAKNLAKKCRSHLKQFRNNTVQLMLLMTWQCMVNTTPQTTFIPAKEPWYKFYRLGRTHGQYGQA